MTALVVVGAQWGDEGKGKIVDLLAESADAVVRWAGGPNAGHTLVIGEERLVLRLVPSGALHARTACVLGQGMAVNPGGLLEEIDELAARGVDVSERLFLSELAHLILPYHLLVDALREGAGDGTRIGTTRRGIGPCYEDKAARRGVRTGDLRRPDHARARVAEALAGWKPIIESLGGEAPSQEEMGRALDEQAARLVPLLRDTSTLVNELCASGKRVMFEGAQGTLLDLDHGTYPFVTSSSAVAGGVCTGVGIGPTRIDRVIGISKAYTTRVGEGPFPTELHDAAGAHLREAGGEYGSVTGRPRRTGWLDLPALRYARQVNGLDGLVLTKLDVLSGLDEVQVAVAYDTPAGRTEVLPVGGLEDASPVYRTLPGWTEPLGSCRSLEALPAPVRRYIAFVEEQIGSRIEIVSLGPRRDDIVVVRDPFA